uniref:Kinesin motor domain-containing protein n=1 Tax=Labrus bergylta TaxID=56723 RepID=A0A3Q3E7D5_9LABR
MGEEFFKVALRIRPLLHKEVLHRHQVCVREVPGSPQVMLFQGNKVDPGNIFHFDYAFGPAASQDEVYDTCVHPLMENLLDGYNATVFCYGPTGSGKTYTLGGMKLGMLYRLHTITHLVEMIDGAGKYIEFLRYIDVFSNKISVRISYMELYKEGLRDLLEMDNNQKVLQIRDDDKGNTGYLKLCKCQSYLIFHID